MPDDLDMANNNTEKTENDEHIGDPKKINFSNTLEVILAIQNKQKQIITKFFNELKNGNFTTIPNFDYKNKDHMEVMKSYIKDPENKNIVFDTYLYLEEHNQERNPNGKEISDILACIQDVYPCKLIGEYELQKLFSGEDLITLGNKIFNKKWNREWTGNDISISDLYGIPMTSIASDLEVVEEFNKRNQERRRINSMELQKVNEFNIQGLNFSKNARILYLDGKEISNDNFLNNEKIYSKIKDKLHSTTKYMEADNNEFLNDISNISKINKEWKNNIYKNIYNQIEEQNENYKFHDTGLNFYTEEEIDEEAMLKNYGKNITMDELKMRHPALEKILEIVQINDDDKPDTAHEKSRLIYLLNHGLFKGFKLVTNTLEKDGVNCLSANNILDENVYKGLVNRLSFYQKEKDENFYKLIDDINDIEINFGSRYIRGTSINQHLGNGGTITNIQDVVALAKSYFIQRIKSGETVNMDIETYKNQLAYMLATIQIESRYQYNAYNNKGKYGGYGQIANYHKNLWIFLIQGSGINLWPGDSEPTVEKLKKIGTKKLLTDHNFSTFGFVYGMTYGHLSNGGNLDKYINDENVNNPNYLGARRIEGGGNAKAFVGLAKDWKKIIDDSIKSD